MAVTVLPESSAEARNRLRGGRQAFTSSEVTGWTRPADWLALPAAQPSDNKFVGLYAVTDDDNNFLAITAAGNYNVDWGDGTSENVNSGTTAYHQYTYSSISAASASTRGYRQVLVTVTPQSSATFTSINARVKHNESGLGNYELKWLDMVIAGSSLTSITIGTSSESVRTRWLEQVQILSSSVTTWASQFQECRGLRSVSVASSATVTSTNRMFGNCYNLESVPLFSTTSVTDMTQMFINCYSLRTVPLFDLSAATTLTSMFSACLSLQIVPLFNTASATDINGMFNGCNSLQAVPLLSVGSVTTFSTTFQTCTSLAVGALSGGTKDISYSSCALSQNALHTIFDNLGKASAGVVTISSNWGAPAVISKASSGTTSGSTTVTIADTSSLTTGMEISGTGISSAVAVTFQDAGDTVTRTAHGIPNDTPVAFASITSTTGIATYTTYYVVNATTNTFQVADTVGGAAKALTTNGSGTCLYGTTISSITTNTSVTLSIPASATGSVTTSSALLKRSKARLKGWTVSG